MVRASTNATPWGTPIADGHNASDPVFQGVRLLPAWCPQVRRPVHQGMAARRKAGGQSNAPGTAIGPDSIGRFEARPAGLPGVVAVRETRP